MLFRDRDDAGSQLAAKLGFLRDQPDLLVLGIPRGGMVVAAQVARALSAPLQVLIAHKIGAPFNAEYAIGAIASTGHVVLDQEAIRSLELTDEAVEKEIELQRAEITRRLELYSPTQDVLLVRDKIAILVDDGVATGLTTMAALHALGEIKPARLVLAVPVGPPDVMERLAQACDQVVTLCTPEPFLAVGRFYAHFGQTTDEQVVHLLEEARARMEKRNPRAKPSD
jgi:predicted phosphoribosyltransferase